MKQPTTLTVNGETHELYAETHHTLLEVLWEHLKLTGARSGCGIGMCGACTVLVDGQPISSCITLAGLAKDKEITTIEGLADGDVLDPVQQAFIDKAGFQCSYCTPGFILTTKALLAENDDPTREEIREYLAGNLCRCGSYLKIEEAVLEAARVLREQNGSGSAASAAAGPANENA